ncbi:MAG: hypothetical protein EOM08_03455 [Clostridia bacterium]|nr:hypothetical protein [Clostridia bacterium]NCC75474.1 hypothetical protein [Clostridia bacterium]
MSSSPPTVRKAKPPCILLRSDSCRVFANFVARLGLLSRSGSDTLVSGPLFWCVCTHDLILSDLICRSIQRPDKENAPMPRPLRQFHPGGIYHITHRGHNKFHIFEETIDKAHFLDILRKVAAETRCHVLYYTIMDNHYHLLIEMQEVPLDKMMRRLNTRYAIYYAKKHRLSGSVFGSHYSASEVNDKKYLVSVIQYIAANPVKPNLVQKINEYRWCAHLEIVARKQENIISNRLFELLGGNNDKGKSCYFKLIQEAQQKVEQNSALDLSLSNRRLNTLESQLMSFLASQNNTPTLKQIRSNDRDQIVSESRRAFTRIAFSQGYKVSEIAKVLNVSERSIYGWCKMIDSTDG